MLSHADVVRNVAYDHSSAPVLNPLDRDDDVGLDEEGFNPFSTDGGWNGEGSQYHPRTVYRLPGLRAGLLREALRRV